MKTEFYYECEECKARVPTTFEEFALLPDDQVVVEHKGPKSETTFLCPAHRVDPRDR